MRKLLCLLSIFVFFSCDELLNDEAIQFGASDTKVTFMVDGELYSSEFIDGFLFRNSWTEETSVPIGDFNSISLGGKSNEGVSIRLTFNIRHKDLALNRPYEIGNTLPDIQTPELSVQCFDDRHGNFVGIANGTQIQITEIKESPLRVSGKFTTALVRTLETSDNPTVRMVKDGEFQDVQFHERSE